MHIQAEASHPAGEQSLADGIVVNQPACRREQEEGHELEMLEVCWQVGMCRQHKCSSSKGRCRGRGLPLGRQSAGASAISRDCCDSDNPSSYRSHDAHTCLQ